MHLVLRYSSCSMSLGFRRGLREKICIVYILLIPYYLILSFKLFSSSSLVSWVRSCRHGALSCPFHLVLRRLPCPVRFTLRYFIFNVSNFFLLLIATPFYSKIAYSLLHLTEYRSDSTLWATSRLLSLSGILIFHSRTYLVNGDLVGILHLHSSIECALKRKRRTSGYFA